MENNQLWEIRRRLTAGGWSRWAPDATLLLLSPLAGRQRLSWREYDREVSLRAGWCSSAWVLPDDERDQLALASFMERPSGAVEVGDVSPGVRGLAGRMARWSRLCGEVGGSDRRALADLYLALVHFGLLREPAGADRTVELGDFRNVLEALPLSAAERTEEIRAQSRHGGEYAIA